VVRLQPQLARRGCSAVDCSKHLLPSRRLDETRAPCERPPTPARMLGEAPCYTGMQGTAGGCGKNDMSDAPQCHDMGDSCGERAGKPVEDATEAVNGTPLHADPAHAGSDAGSCARCTCSAPLRCSAAHPAAPARRGRLRGRMRACRRSSAQRWTPSWPWRAARCCRSIQLCSACMRF
jgi:hypothetical protein